MGELEDYTSSWRQVKESLRISLFTGVLGGGRMKQDFRPTVRSDE